MTAPLPFLSDYPALQIDSSINIGVCFIVFALPPVSTSRASSPSSSATAHRPSLLAYSASAPCYNNPASCLLLLLLLQQLLYSTPAPEREIISTRSFAQRNPLSPPSCYSLATTTTRLKTTPTAVQSPLCQRQTPAAAASGPQSWTNPKLLPPPSRH